MLVDGKGEVRDFSEREELTLIRRIKLGSSHPVRRHEQVIAVRPQGEAKAIELEEIEALLSELERTAEASKPSRR